MVKRQSAFAKNSRREIRKTLGRYLAILAIVALGVGFFSGLRVTRQAMIKTADTYLQEQSFFDFRLISTLGLTRDDVESFASLEGVEKAEGTLSPDFLQVHEDGSESAWKALLISDINTPKLQAGRMPEKADEVLADAGVFNESVLGTKLVLSPNNTEDLLDTFVYEEYTVVGLASSPLYLNVERGTTTLADGKLKGFYCFLPDGLSSEYYTEIYVTIEKSGTIFSDTYGEERDALEPALTALLEERAEIRYRDIFSRAEDTYQDGWDDYQRGLDEYHTERVKAEQELADAEAELAEARQTLDDAKAELESNAKKLTEAEQDIQKGEADYQQGLSAWESGKAEYESAKAETEQTLAEKQAELDEARASAEEAKAQLQAAGAEELTAQYAALQETAAQLQATLAGLAAASAEEQPDAGSAGAVKAEGSAEESSPEADTAGEAETAEPDNPTLPDAAALQTRLAQVQAAMAQIEGSGILEAWQLVQDGLLELDDAQAQLDAAVAEAEQGFAEAEAELAQNEAVLAAARQKLQSAKTQLADGQRAFSQGMMDYQAGEEKYESGLQEYQEAREEADSKFADAEAELADAEAELADARREINEIEPADTYVLDRDTNVGYVCYDNDSQIVQSVSKLFPVFFFLVAALICITTMTRMVEDQRTQIGTLKALGYSNGRIVWKYVSYSGSAAVLGSVSGFYVGSILFPKCIWMGYALLYGFGKISPVFNYGLGLLSLAAALLCSAGATYLACRKDLHQVPAELMRPKAPAVGKRIWMEYIPVLWKRFSFLHKVTARNIFRYRKRLVMMVLGIGGCTALVLTGLGLRDSICNIALDQFGTIMPYDYTITFPEGMTEDERASFPEETADLLDSCTLVCSDSVTVEGGGVKKTANILACSSDSFSTFLCLLEDGKALSAPTDGGAYISNNLAERLSLKKGDTLTLYTDEVHTVSLPVQGVFDNHVSFYVLMTGSTYESVLEKNLQYNTAFAEAGAGDLHEIAKELVNDRGASSVSVIADLEERVGKMLSAMDYIVALIIACAAALAFVVLFNLSNINITERVREIATIEVLGFSDRETAAYVFRENAILTLMGAVVGLPLGKALHAYVMGEIKIDMVSFETRITLTSYLAAFFLTFVFTLIVDLIMRRKLHDIHMAEALKSVE